MHFCIRILCQCHTKSEVFIGRAACARGSEASGQASLGRLRSILTAALEVVQVETFREIKQNRVFFLFGHGST